VKVEGIAVVTGASRGIGRAVALELATRGFEVVATMRDPGAGSDLPMRVARLDVTDPDTIDLPEGLRVLVNNAGVEVDHLPFEATPLDLWREMFETNVFGLVETIRRAIPLLRANGGGVICNITSSSLIAPVPFYAPYRASKAAVSALGESLRAELAPFGIRVVEILPGAIATDMFEHSKQPPAAVEHEPYRPMAELAMKLREPINDQATPVVDAAAAIVDAILDDGGPLRHGCDPMGIGLLEHWRRTPDEDLMTGFLLHWGAPASPNGP
jgi:NAD(P)-dependent dehydrogenase (short-subunit alcohol dehydrogenase family)